MKKLSGLYIKHIIKSSVIYYSFILTGVLGFIILSLTIKIDIITSYDGIQTDNKIVINDYINNDINKLYMYKSRNEKVFFLKINVIEYIESYTVLYIDNNTENISGIVNVDVVTGECSLLEFIFIKVGKKDKM